MSKKMQHEPPFSGYRVTLAPDAATAALVHFAGRHPALAALVRGQPFVVVSSPEAAALYDMTRSDGGDADVTLLLGFTPVRCSRARALPFESVSLSAMEILYLVHEGLFGALCCREAAIAAVQVCGALPVPELELPPVPRRSMRAAAERHVDVLIEREAELHARAAVKRSSFNA